MQVLHIYVAINETSLILHCACHLLFRKLHTCSRTEREIKKKKCDRSVMLKFVEKIGLLLKAFASSVLAGERGHHKKRDLQS